MAEETRGPTLKMRETVMERRGMAILRRQRVAFIWRPDEAEGGVSVDSGVVVDWRLCSADWWIRVISEGGGRRFSRRERK